MTAWQPARANLASAETIAQQRKALDRLVQVTEQPFQEKQAGPASARRDWCNPILAERKIDAVQAFLKAFHDENKVEIATCSICYMKKKPSVWVAPCISAASRSQFTLLPTTRHADKVETAQSSPKKFDSQTSSTLILGRAVGIIGKVVNNGQHEINKMEGKFA